jgi:Universal stress protein family
MFMKSDLESNTIRRVMVGTDRSETADRAVHWAAGFADRYDAELFVVQVVVPQYPSATEFGEANVHALLPPTMTWRASRGTSPGSGAMPWSLLMLIRHWRSSAPLSRKPSMSWWSAILAWRVET